MQNILSNIDLLHNLLKNKKLNNKLQSIDQNKKHFKRQQKQNLLYKKQFIAEKNIILIKYQLTNCITNLKIEKINN